jgi:putative transposase
MNTIQQLNQQAIPIQSACKALALPRSSYYRHQALTSVTPPVQKELTLATEGKETEAVTPPRVMVIADTSEPAPTTPDEPPLPLTDTRPSPSSPRTLSAAEEATVRQILHSDRFMDSSPYQVYGTLLDEGHYYCSIATMYRLLRAEGEQHERRRHQVHPAYTKPELLATAPNQLWTWDITKLRSPVKWHYYYLYVLLDAFSRYVVGWLIAERESAQLAEELIAASCQQQNIQRDQLTIHSDRGGPMTAKSLALFLTDLGVAQSHSRPYTSNDNPFSEAQFKTLKYRPDYPDRFGSLADARTWANPFFAWYNHQHRHTALGLLTPATVHQGLAQQYHQQRQQVLQAAYARHPERFIKGQPLPPALPTAVWINPPKPTDTGSGDTDNSVP